MEILYLIIGLLVAVTVHEFSHAYLADRLGDPTPRLQGRVTLNPLAHLDPIGTLMLIFFRFGWGKPVQVNPQYFRVPLRDSAIVSLAGPLSNFLVAFVLALLLKETHFLLPGWSQDLFEMVLNINLVLGIFNLLPFPPFDGSKVIGVLIPPRWVPAYTRYLEKGVFYVILFVLFDYLVIAPIVGTSVIQFTVFRIFVLVKSVFFLGG